MAVMLLGGMPCARSMSAAALPAAEMLRLASCGRWCSEPGFQFTTMMFAVGLPYLFLKQFAIARARRWTRSSPYWGWLLYVPFHPCVITYVGREGSGFGGKASG